MIDVTRSHVWAWDARPFPHFPHNLTVWSDGENYRAGHWINGRSGNRTLESVVSEICKRAGVDTFDASQLIGVVNGYVHDEVSDARSALQPLMVAYGFDAIERNGCILFRMRGTSDPVDLEVDSVAVSSSNSEIIAKDREANVEIAGRLRLNFVQAGGAFEAISEEAIDSAELTNSVAASEMPLVLSRGEGRQILERWLAEAKVGRERVKFSLPPSKFGLGAGDVVALKGDGQIDQLYRIDRVEQGDSQLVEGLAIEPSVYEKTDLTEELPRASAYVPPVPVTSLFMDLPLLTGDEVPHAPHIAVTAKPWPGSVAVYDSATDSDYALNKIINSRAIMGVTETPLLAARPGLFDNGTELQVKMISGNLQGVSQEQLFSGRNLMAIGDGANGSWELFQFEEAQLVGPGQYLLSKRLRGQLGSDAGMPDVWPTGSWVVLVDGNIEQIDLSAASRNIARNFRIGSARQSLDHSSYRNSSEAFAGIGLRPYSPVHLQASRATNGDVALNWIRRSRIDGDSWEFPEIPLSEETEQYLVRISKYGSVLRETTVSSPSWLYLHSEQLSDGASDAFDVEVAQVSARFGPGAFGKLEVSWMWRVLAGDIVAVARWLQTLPQGQRAQAVEDVIERASAAHKFFRRFGRSHPDWGNGSLYGAITMPGAGPEPSFSNVEYCRSTALVLMKLTQFREFSAGR
ncbi:putative tail protein [Shimia abyssi]|uniref:Putative tail protein n=1 Tax=Shimia abyssi TaxID=1662395 RepID=A0A2P8FFT9_9RHOB|nr:putative tail protein [Shimia abyssi]